jgi:hypothetical protein
MKKLLTLFLVLSFLVGCTPKQVVKFTKDDASIVVNGVTLTPGMKYSNPALSGWLEFAELTSCAYKGNDKVYEYTGFSLFTYSDGNDDFILSIEFSDSTQTKKGLKIGSTKANVIKAYGEDFETKLLNMVYTDGQINLTFLVINDKVEGISLNYKPQ